MQDEFTRVLALFQSLTEHMSKTAYEAEGAVEDLTREALEEPDESRRAELERRTEVLQDLIDLVRDAAGEVDHQVASQPADELEAA
mgnify:CR=1 FL=1